MVSYNPNVAKKLGMQQVRNKIISQLLQRMLKTVIKDDQVIGTVLIQKQSIFDFQKYNSRADDYRARTPDLLEGETC